MIERQNYLDKIVRQFKIHPVCGLLGPRQSGKTTLAKKFSETFQGPVTHFDLENPQDLIGFDQPLRILENLKGLVIIDEVQRVPELFPLLRVLADRGQAKFLILGSASRELIQQSSETLAGRIGYIELPPFQLFECGDIQKLLMRGGFPKSFLAENDQESFEWREAYIQTFLERDIPSLGFSIPPLALYRFWMMLANVHGQLLNTSQLGSSFGATAHTIRKYIDLLAGTFMIRVLQPWHENISKRQVKAPKLYFRDSGILLSMLRVSTQKGLLTHPALGAIWEGFALEQVISKLQIRSEEVFFWRTNHGAELDLLTHLKDGKRTGFEFKYADAPKTTKSMHLSIEDLGLEKIYIIYPGERDYILDDKISVVGLVNFVKNQNKEI